VPYITTLAAAKAAVKGITAYGGGGEEAKSLQSYHEGIKRA
jgi:carbamoyl-phosphate synthase large subunit